MNWVLSSLAFLGSCVYFLGYSVSLRRLLTKATRGGYKSIDGETKGWCVIGASIWPVWVWMLPWIFICHYVTRTLGTTRRERKEAARVRRLDEARAAIKKLERDLQLATYDQL